MSTPGASHVYASGVVLARATHRKRPALSAIYNGDTVTDALFYYSVSIFYGGGYFAPVILSCIRVIHRYIVLRS